MSEQVGVSVFRILEQAGEHWLPPEVFRIFLFHIGGAQAVLRYRASETYWEQIQTILDSFFTPSQRAEVCDRLLERSDLRARPEFRGFRASALAERRLRDMLADARLNRPAHAR